MNRGLLLVDKSALLRLPEGEANAFDDEELCLCAVTRLEVLYSARSPDHHSEIERALETFRDLRMDAETFATARTAQRELASAGEHRLPIPDLLIAACAQQHSADVLHLDRHYDSLASVLAFRARRLRS